MPKKRNSVPAADNSAFRERLKSCVAAVGGQVKMSELTAIPRGTLANHLANTEPQRPSLLAIARAAQVNIAWLVDGIGPRDVSIIETQNWISVREFLGCSITAAGGIEIKHGSPTLMIPRSRVSVAFLGCEISALNRLVSFSVNDNYMSPELVLHETAVCQVERTVRPANPNGMYAILENNAVYARNVQRHDQDTLILADTKFGLPGARKVSISKLGSELIILGRVVAVWAWPGFRPVGPDTVFDQPITRPI